MSPSALNELSVGPAADPGGDSLDLWTKQEILRKTARLSDWDLFYDPDTGRIYLRRKNGTGEAIDTGLTVGDDFSCRSGF